MVGQPVQKCEHTGFFSSYTTGGKERRRRNKI
jgi:hypothetical protein